MTTKDPRQKGMNWLTPYLVVSDIAASLAFYEKVFGFTPSTTVPGPDGAIMHAEMTYGEATIIMFGPEGTGPARPPAHSGVEPPVGLYVYCEDVNAVMERARREGAKITSEPEEAFWGDRIASLLDPDGYSWTFATKFRDFDLSQMPPQD